MTHKKKIFILYRVIQHWRAPIFERLSRAPNIDIKLLYGPDFPGTKVISSKASWSFKKSKLVSFKYQRESSNGTIAIPFSIFLFPYLVFAQPKVVISEGASNLFNALQGFLYCKIFRRRFIWWSLGKLNKRDYDVRRRKIDWLIRTIETNSDAIISYSSLGRDYFLSLGIDKDKIYTAVNVVDTDTKLKNLKSLDTVRIYNDAHRKYSFNVLFVGALTKEKKVDLLIRAFAKLEERFNDVSLNIVGDGGEYNTLVELSKRLAAKNIFFHGNVVEGVDTFFVSSDVFVLPGLGGLAISEAMVYGLPVIASIGDGCEVDLVDETSGILDVDLDETRLVNYLITLYEDRAMLNHLKDGAKRKILDHYNVGNYIDQVVKSIEGRPA